MSLDCDASVSRDFEPTLKALQTAGTGFGSTTHPQLRVRSDAPPSRAIADGADFSFAQSPTNRQIARIDFDQVLNAPRLTKAEAQRVIDEVGAKLGVSFVLDWKSGSKYQSFEDFLTPEQAALYLGCSTSWLAQRALLPDGPMCFEIEDEPRYHKDQLDEYIEFRRRNAEQRHRVG